MSRVHKTAKGTELPIMLLRGKEYLEVKYRLVWFREDHPDWGIETEVRISPDGSSTLGKATIKDDKGRVIAMGHKTENKQGFADHTEKAETGAIGRALALIGYGTQFCADELDEGKRIVDGPVEKQNAPHAKPVTKIAAVPADAGSPGEYVCKLKKYAGKRLVQIPIAEMESYVEWLESSAKEKGDQLKGDALSLKIAFERYAKSVGGDNAPPFGDEDWPDSAYDNSRGGK